MANVNFNTYEIDFAITRINGAEIILLRFVIYYIFPPHHTMYRNAKLVIWCQCCQQRVALPDADGAANFFGDNNPAKSSILRTIPVAFIYKNSFVDLITLLLSVSIGVLYCLELLFKINFF